MGKTVEETIKNLKVILLECERMGNRRCVECVKRILKKMASKEETIQKNSK